MDTHKHPTRRTALSSSLTILSASVFAGNPLYAAKKSGEVQVLFLLGDIVKQRYLFLLQKVNTAVKGDFGDPGRKLRIEPKI